MLLFDQNISYRIIKKVNKDFPNSLHVSRTGLTVPASDKAIWTYAKSHHLTSICPKTLILSFGFNKVFNFQFSFLNVIKQKCFDAGGGLKSALFRQK